LKGTFTSYLRSGSISQGQPEAVWRPQTSRSNLVRCWWGENQGSDCGLDERVPEPRPRAGRRGKAKILAL